MTGEIAKSSKRFEVVDALRGFAIVSIMLLHNLEHFDFYFTPENLPGWMIALDAKIWDSMFFLFGGKSYAIFSLLFGLTFFIQFNNQAKKGNDFRGRFAWRMVLLLFFGVINSAFYQGDILSIYAIIGFFILPVAKLNNKTIFWIAVILMLQPYEWFKFFGALQNPDMQISDPLSWTYFGIANQYIPGDSFWATIIGNLTNGKKAVLLWTWEQGRVFQTLSLFMLGMLAGRKTLFALTEENKKFWKKTLLFSSISFLIFYVIKLNLGDWITSKAIHRPLETIENSWTNLSFMLILVSGFVTLFQTKLAYKFLHLFSPLGCMSLSNYIMQSIVGSCIYYGFGLAMYQYTGATYSLIIGTALAILQGFFSAWWMRNNKRGPLETIWHKLTWINSDYNK